MEKVIAKINIHFLTEQGVIKIIYKDRIYFITHVIIKNGISYAILKEKNRDLLFEIPLQDMKSLFEAVQL